MSDFRIFETEEFQKKLEKLTCRDARFVRRKLIELVYPLLREDPFHGPNIKKLGGYDPPTWRCRIGKFRIFFLVDQAERTVFIISADQRKDAYR